MSITYNSLFRLSWEAATERFLNEGAMTYDMKSKSKKSTDKFIAWVHELVSWTPYILLYSYVYVYICRNEHLCEHESDGRKNRTPFLVPISSFATLLYMHAYALR
jgi:hypothetical protein